MKLNFAAGLLLFDTTKVLSYQSVFDKKRKETLQSLPKIDGATVDHSLQTSVIIDNGVIMLGINHVGELNAPSDIPDGHSPDVTEVGLRYYRNGAWYDSTSYGTQSEGFGVSASIVGGSSFWGGSNQDHGEFNISPQPLVTVGGDTATAVATVTTGPLRITHEYFPSPDSPNMYEGKVTYENTSPDKTLTDLRYRRVMDWDIPPTHFKECVSILYSAVPNDLEYVTDNGFEEPNPLKDASDPGGDYKIACPSRGNCPASNTGPSDHGALFNFLFKEGGNHKTLGPGGKMSFSILYGAAPTKPEADSVITDVGAEIWSYGFPKSPSSSCDGTGSPNVFIFGFKNVGGDPNPKCCKSCTKTGKVTGDPHYTVWSGAGYDYHGGCDQIAIDNDIFQLQFRTRPRLGGYGHYSIPTRVALWFKNDPDHYIRIDWNGDIMVNTIPASIIKTNLDNGYRYVYFTEYPGSEIRLESRKHDKHMNVEVKGTGSLLCGSNGMFGNWDKGGVTKYDGSQVIIKAYQPQDIRIEQLAESWKVPVRKGEPNYLKDPTEIADTICDHDRGCGPGYTFDCDTTRRRHLQDNVNTHTSCGLTCDDIMNPVLKSFCLTDIDLTGDDEWACQKSYTDPLVGDPVDIDPCDYVDERGSNRFVKFQKSGSTEGKWKIRDCDWLNTRLPKTIDRICRNDVDYWEEPDSEIMYGPPQKACPKTCNSCDPCYENPKTKYTNKSTKSGKGANRKCSDLNKNTKKEAICKRSKSAGGYPKPGVGCPQTCGRSGCIRQKS